METSFLSTLTDTDRMPSTWPHPNGGNVELIETDEHRRVCSRAYDATYNGSCIGHVVYLGKAHNSSAFKEGSRLWVSTRDLCNWSGVTDDLSLVALYVTNFPPVC